MTASAIPKRAEILCVRVRHAKPDTGALRAWLRDDLPRTDLHPPALPPSAILIVRKLDGALPRAVTAPPAVRVPAFGWDRRLRADLEALLAQAARPQHGLLPADAIAVVFADRAELVACLVADILRGVATRWWWWEAPLREVGGPDVTALLGRRVELLPGALDLLQRWDLATSAVQRVDAAGCVRLLAALVSAFTLTKPSAPRSTARDEPTGRTDPGTTVPAGHRARGGESSRPPPWERWLGTGTVPGHLAPEQGLLLATALLLHRAPGAARSPQIVAALELPGRTSKTWWQPGYMSSMARPTVPPVPPPTVLPPAPGRRCDPAATASAAANAPAPSPADDTHLRDPSSTSLPPSTLRPPAPDSGAATDSAQHPRTPPRVHPRPAPDVEMPTEGTPEPDRASLSPGVVRTGLAGVMYLLNLTDRLGLPDHADPRWRLPELSGWAQLEVLARGLLDQDYVPGEEHDPLWRLLAELDGRPPQCAVGFEVAELGMGNPPPDEPIPTALMRSVATGTRRWMRTASPSAGRRLAAELGMKTAADAAAALRVPGLIHHSRTHVDVVMDLDSISVPVRLAGLDQDPGWVPRLGRVVAFIFTSDGPA